MAGSSVVVDVMSWEANGWALAEDAELWLIEVLRRSQTRGQGVVAKLKPRTRNSQRKRKETKVKERKDVTRLGGFSSHRGSSWRAGQSTLEWRSKNAESDDKKHG